MFCFVHSEVCIRLLFCQHITFLLSFKQVPTSHSDRCEQDRHEHNYPRLQNLNANHDCSYCHAEDGSPRGYKPGCSYLHRSSMCSFLLKNTRLDIQSFHPWLILECDAPMQASMQQHERHQQPAQLWLVLFAIVCFL